MTLLDILRHQDPELAQAVDAEAERQRHGIELIASENYVSAAVQCILLLISKPFKIGDRVSIGDHAGTVVDITLQDVVLELDAESFMRIPHSVVKDSAIITIRESGQRRK